MYDWTILPLTARTGLKQSIEEQVKAVIAELKKRNPGFDGEHNLKVEDGVVTEFQFLTDAVTDIRPVRALTGLQTLNCCGTTPRKGKLADLSPLQGMKLKSLNCRDTAVSDLSPLKGMPLTSLYCDATAIADLSPLKDLPLVHLDCANTAVSDLSPLKGMPLEMLVCDFNAKRDGDILRSITRLRFINQTPARDFWKEVDANSTSSPDRDNTLSLAGSTWAGQETLAGYGRIVFAFESKDMVIMEDKDGKTAGRYSQKDKSVALSFPGPVNYNGTINGNTIIGTASNPGSKSWQWTVNKQAGPVQPISGKSAAAKLPIDLENAKGQASWTSELSSTDPPYGQKEEHHKLFFFNMEAGKTYQIDMTSRAFDSYLYLEDPDGALLAQDDDSGSFTDARIFHKATKTGKHRIIAARSQNRLGQFTLTIRETDGAARVQKKKPDPKSEAQKKKADKGNLVTKSSGLKYIDLEVGTGKAAKTGDTVTVHYTGTLKDGKKFGSTLDLNIPFTFQIGKPRGPEVAGLAGPGALIKCWDEGVSGMKQGGKRKLIVPPALGFAGPVTVNGVLVVPRNSELHVEVELLKLE